MQFTETPGFDQQEPSSNSYTNQALKRIRDEAVLQQVYSEEYQDSLARLMANHLITINTRYLYEPQIQRIEKDLHEHTKRLDCMNKTLRQNEQVLESNQLESLVKNKYKLESKFSNMENFVKQVSIEQSKSGREMNFMHNHIRKGDEATDRLYNRIQILEDQATSDREMIYGLQKDVHALLDEVQALKKRSTKDGDVIIDVLRMLDSIGLVKRTYV